MTTTTFVRIAALPLLACLVSVAAPAAAQPARQAPPPPAADRPFEFPGGHVQQLPNGLTVLVVEDRRQPLVSFSLLFPAGATAQPAGKEGLAAMVAGLLDKGTSTRTAQDIARAIDRVGGSLSAAADADFAQVNATALKPSAALALELLADVVVRPTFKEDEVERLRRQVLSGLQVQFADAEFVATAVARRVAYGSHPYAIGADGTPDTIRALTREDIAAFHKARYVPDGAVLAVAGDVTAAEALALVQTHLGGWSGKAAPPQVAEPRVPARGAVLVDRADSVQTQIRVGTVAVPRNHPDYFPLLIANQAFGGSFNSRLNMKLRANEGLTYGARSLVDADRHAGWWGVSTYTRTEETARAVALIEDLLRDFRETPITEAELKEAKGFLIGSFAIGAETPAQVAAKLLEARAYGLPADYWQKYRDNVRAVTAEQIAAAVRKYVHPDRMELVAVGKASGFAPSLTSFGTPRVVPFADLDLTAPDLRRAGTAVAATPEAATRGKAIVARALAAAGGAEKLAAIKDLTTRGTVKLTTPMGEMSGEAVAEVVYPDKMRSTITLPMGQMVQAFDGTSGWMKMGPQAMDLPPAMLPEMRRGVVSALGIELLRKAASGEAEVTALDPAEVDGRKVDAVRWKLGDVEMTAFFDAETQLLAKLAYRSVTPQGATDVEVFPSDYREVDGVRVPFKVVGRQNGQPYIDSVSSAVTFNAGIDPAGFGKPQP